jgi:hypothetical protein
MGSYADHFKGETLFNSFQFKGSAIIVFLRNSCKGQFDEGRR